MSGGALSGMRVLDLTRLLPGAYCSMMLGDLGAEIIKIENPDGGDYLREFSPKLKKKSAFFLSINRNKKSITLNLKETRGKAILLDLVETADVLLEGFRPGVMDKMGIGFNDLIKVNPRIVVCSISGYGQNGPYAKKAGHDLNYLSIAGITGFTGTKEGKPIIPGVQIADIGGGGMLAAYCILAAIINRVKTGKGQYIDISMTDGALAWLCMYAGKYFVDGKSPKSSSELLTEQFACYNVYKTKCGRYISLAALESQFWLTFCKTIERKDLIPIQFAPGKRANELIAEIEKIFLERTREEWMELLKNADCCCEPVNSFDEVFSHPQVVARNMLCEMEHPTEGTICQISFPAKFSDTPARMELAPPTLGQHTKEILRELGITSEEIAILAKEKIIG